MAGCIPCFVIPLLLFIFHRYIQPIILKFWNPWGKVETRDGDKQEDCKFSCECFWNKDKKKGGTGQQTEVASEISPSEAVDKKLE